MVANPKNLQAIINGLTGKKIMIMTVKEFVNACERYAEEYKIEEYRKSKITGKTSNNYASAKKRLDFIIDMLNNLGEVDSLEGLPMSARAPYVLNAGSVAEMIVAEFFYRINGYGKHTALNAMSIADYDIAGKNGLYEVKFQYSGKYRCTALNPNSRAKFVYYVTPNGIYKLPFDIALESEEQYGNGDKYRSINLKNIVNAEQYLLATYTKILLNK